MRSVLTAAVMLAAALAVRAGEAAAGGPLPRGSGLAAKYLKDAGIAGDPAVIFHEDFEDDRMPARGWYDLRGWGKNQTVTRDEHMTGRGCLRLHFPKGSSGPFNRAPQLAPKQDRLHFRWYRKWEPSWDWGGKGDGNGHDAMLYIEPPGGAKHAYHEEARMRVYLENVSKVYGKWKRGFFGIAICSVNRQDKAALFDSYKKHVAAGGKVMGTAEFRFPTVTGKRTPIRTGRWYCVETMVKMNTPGKADGRVRQWIDGVLTFDVGEIMLRDRANPDLAVRQWRLGPYFHGGTPKDQTCYLDSLVIAKSYIGPVQKEPPGPPEAAVSKPAGGGAPGAPSGEPKVGRREKDAGRLFQMARRAERMGQRDVAASLYRQIVEKYPETGTAAKAKAKLE